ncbi:hypothetical protein Goshw_007445 [Gossypium schwendimanii]|uniref:RNase H type-1 domain-containing protein n=1 Tax=Gossypium schwendimanii TaxID=34291 RepID=A0A7J9LME9_GOSSC|nr:hypothetical protein [Gossypium schwendimanii]
MTRVDRRRLHYLRLCVYHAILANTLTGQRESTGDIVCSKVVINENVPSVFVAETLAYIQSVHLGLDLGLMKVEIEGGALSIIRKLWREYDDKFKIGAYIRDRKWLSKRFLTCKFKYIYRSMNSIAHLLATKGLKRGD